MFSDHRHRSVYIMCLRGIEYIISSQLRIVLWDNAVDLKSKHQHNSEPSLLIVTIID